MNVEEFKKEASDKLENLVPCRKIAYDNAVDLKVVLWNEKYWDLLALYENKWHYIYTIEK